MKLLFLSLTFIFTLVFPYETFSMQWTERTLPVQDFSTNASESLIAEVADFNAHMPPNGPHLVYQRMDGPCPPPYERRHVITACTGDVTPQSAAALTYQRGDPDQPGRMLSAQMVFDDDLVVTTHYVCHEMMHAVTGIWDNYGARNEDSCVWGWWLEQLGPYDIILLNDAYAKDLQPPKHKKKRKR